MIPKIACEQLFSMKKSTPVPYVSEPIIIVMHDSLLTSDASILSLSL